MLLTSTAYPAPIPGGFDNQASYADVKANVSIPMASGTQAQSGEANISISTATAAAHALPEIKEQILDNTQLKDGLSPEVYYTYQIVFVPDLSQKYGLRIKGGPGEIRAAMNLVNGWMYTGKAFLYGKKTAHLPDADKYRFKRHSLEWAHEHCAQPTESRYWWYKWDRFHPFISWRGH